MQSHKVEPEYGQYFSDTAFWKKIESLSGKGWCEALKQLITVYTLLKTPTTTVTTKMLLIAAFGNSAPVDAIPDLIPLIGYSDDFSMIGMLLRHLQNSITPAIQQKVQTLLPKNCQ